MVYDRSSSTRVNQRRKRPSGAYGTLNNLRLELTALILSCFSMGKLSGTAVGAFLVLPPRMSSNTRVKSQQVSGVTSSAHVDDIEHQNRVGECN